MLAALGVWGTSTAWPDLIVAAIMAGLFLYSSVQIIGQSRGEFRSVDTQMAQFAPPRSKDHRNRIVEHGALHAMSDLELQELQR